ncbi:hypothetical protein KJ611_00695 [Patescibacteria group bacterium]|nr:hypothetical protein [Patescibacteria group bacterium]MBU1705103.1 hypothetical protein [Patescibacteria group bacterium]
MTKRIVNMPSNEDLANMDQAQITTLADQLGNRVDRLALITKWSMLKSNRQHRTEQQKLNQNHRRLARCTVSKAELARLKRATELAHNATSQALADQGTVIKKLGQTAVNHRVRLDQQAQAINGAAEQHAAQEARLQACEEQGAETWRFARIKEKELRENLCRTVISANQTETEVAAAKTELRRLRVLNDFRTRQLLALQQELAKHNTPARVVRLETQLHSIRTEIERSTRLFRELPEMRTTRSLVLMGQSVKQGLANLMAWRPARVAVAATFLVLIATAYSHSEVSLAHAQGTALAEAVIQCSFMNPRTGEHGIKPMFAKKFRDQMYNVLNCGNANELELYGTTSKALPKDGIFARSEVIKLPQ